MALGKNLKKQKLIPSVKEDSDKTVVKSKSVKTTASSKIKINKPAKNKRIKKDLPTGNKKRGKILKENTDVEIVIIPDKKELPEKERPIKYLTESEYNQRKRLREKFSNELKSLANQKVHLIVFKLGNEDYAIEIDKTKEVVKTPPISKVAHSPKYITGVSNIRGKVILNIDLANKFNIDHSIENLQYTMVIKSDIYSVGILLDSVPSSLVVNGKDISYASEYMADTTLDDTYVKGLIKKKEGLIFFIDIEELLEGDRMSFSSGQIK